MIYSFEAYAVQDNELKSSYKTYGFESNARIRDKNILKDEILTYVKAKIFPEYDVILNSISPSCLAIKQDYKNEVPEKLKEIFDRSTQEWNEYLQSDLYKEDKFISDLHITLKQVQLNRDKAIELNMPDSQEFLNYQDELNKASLDPDRK